MSILCKDEHYCNRYIKRTVQNIFPNVKSAIEIKPIRSNVEELIFPSGKKVYLLAKGRLANLVLSEGHPAEVMDMSFGLQSLMSEYIVKNKDKLRLGMVNVLVEIDDRVGFLKLKSMGIQIDKLTEKQYNYIHGFLEGT